MDSTSNYYYNYIPYNNGYFRATTTDTQLISDIQKAINGEYSAISCYEKLAKMAPNKEQWHRILEIHKDEVRHFEAFRRAYTKLTGRQATYEITEKCPDNYLAGLEFAFNDEQNTVDFYHELSDRLQDASISEQFQRAAADEQNHAVWFLSFLLKTRGML
jgi:rubrerythrin